MPSEPTGPVIEVLLPRLSDSMEDGLLLAWKVRPGDPVAAGQVLAAIATGEAPVDLEAEGAGVVQALLVPEGARATVGQAVCALALSAPPRPSAPPRAAAPAPTRLPPAAPTVLERHAQPAAAPVAPPAPPPPALVAAPSPALAAAPVRAHTPPAGLAPSFVPARNEGHAVPLSEARAALARAAIESAAIPQFQATLTVDPGPILGLRHRFERAPGQPLQLSHFVARACAVALRRHPQLNACFGADGRTVAYHARVHLGVAIAIDDSSGGRLVMATLRDADRLGLADTGARLHALVERARARRLRPEEASGATFGLSNLGGKGIEHFTALVPPGAAAILAVGAARETPVVRGGKVVPGHEMTLTLSCDHRVLDGAAAAGFLASLRQLLEAPLLLVEPSP